MLNYVGKRISNLAQLTLHLPYKYSTLTKKTKQLQCIKLAKGHFSIWPIFILMGPLPFFLHSTFFTKLYFRYRNWRETNFSCDTFFDDISIIKHFCFGHWWLQVGAYCTYTLTITYACGILLKNGPFRPLFLYFRLFKIVDSKCSI